MRWIPNLIMLSGLLIGTAACDRPVNTDDRRTREEKTDQAAHQAGEDAYKATAKAKELAREAAEKSRKPAKRSAMGGKTLNTTILMPTPSTPVSDSPEGMKRGLETIEWTSWSNGHENSNSLLQHRPAERHIAGPSCDSARRSAGP